MGKGSHGAVASGVCLFHIIQGLQSCVCRALSVMNGALDKLSLQLVLTPFAWPEKG